MKSLYKFLVSAVHDLTQPVQALELALGEIDRKTDVAIAPIDLNAVRVSVDRMRELIEMLMEICRIESCPMSVEKHPVEVGEIFQYLQLQFAPLARRKGISLICEPVGYVIQTNAMLLRSMLSNLVSNGIRYTRDGYVRLRAQTCRNGALRMQVSDTGVGIDGAELQRIFGDFCRLDQARRTVPEGFGLGLGIVRRVSRVLDLPVAVSSTVGQGSTFSVEVRPERVLVKDNLRRNN